MNRNAKRAELGQETQVRREGDHRSGAGRDTVDGRDHRERALAQRPDDGSGHARELEQIAGLHRLQGADDLDDVTARAEPRALAGDDDHPGITAMGQLGEQVAEIGVDVEGQCAQFLRDAPA